LSCLHRESKDKKKAKDFEDKFEQNKLEKLFNPNWQEGINLVALQIESQLNNYSLIANL
jgi:hypothetical protein